MKSLFLIAFAYSALANADISQAPVIHFDCAGQNMKVVGQYENLANQVSGDLSFDTADKSPSVEYVKKTVGTKVHFRGIQVFKSEQIAPAGTLHSLSLNNADYSGRSYSEVIFGLQPGAKPFINILGKKFELNCDFSGKNSLE
ncbi:MAG: hypothetical protein AB7N80_15045 [Bdellovibrionales bacterium]